jgi:hypothetical protein
MAFLSNNSDNTILPHLKYNRPIFIGNIQAAMDEIVACTRLEIWHLLPPQVQEAIRMYLIHFLVKPIHQTPMPVQLVAAAILAAMFADTVSH